VSCSWIPPAVYLGGPQDGLTAAAAKRVSGTVHPPYRTPDGRIAGGDQAPAGPHYRFQTEPDCGACRWGRHYVWTGTDEEGPR